MCFHSPNVPGLFSQTAQGVCLLGLVSAVLSGCGQQDMRPVIPPPVVVPTPMQEVSDNVHLAPGPEEFAPPAVPVSYDWAPQSAPAPSQSVAAEPPPALESQLMALLQSAFHQQRQQIFNQLHPIGTAKQVVVHDVEIDWKRGLATDREEDVKTFTVRYTVFWEGPFTKDGYTKLSSIYDVELERYVGVKILATNGVTNEDAFFAVGVALGAAARLALEE